jgi:adenine deaminase
MLEARDIGRLFDLGLAHYLSEVMNFPAVVNGDPQMMAIIHEAQSRGLPIDGHAPGLMGDALEAYANAGVQTDHECFTLEQARARLKLGMKVAIREGSAACNFDALWPILLEQPADVFLCTDDLHPDKLVKGHMDRLLARAIAKGVDPMAAIRAATLNPVSHYNLPVGLLQPGDPADMIELADLVEFKVLNTWIDGECLASEGTCLIAVRQPQPLNYFQAEPISASDLYLPAPSTGSMPVIIPEDGQLVTKRKDLVPLTIDGEVIPDLDRDLLKLVVVNRYKPSPPSVALIQGFGMKTGAMAGTVAHDSHNIIAVGANDEALVRAINLVIEHMGGLAYADAETFDCFPLPIAGLMSCADPETAAEAFTGLTEQVRKDGCQLSSPFMTLSFMALLVIPSLKLSDLGLFDGDLFALI